MSGPDGAAGRRDAALPTGGEATTTAAAAEPAAATDPATPPDTGLATHPATAADPATGGAVGPAPAEALERGAPAAPGHGVLLLGAFGDAGHTVPIIALGAALRRAGHEVVVQTGARWRQEVRAAGLGFATAPEYRARRRDGRPLKPYEAVLRGVADTGPLLDALRPDAVIADLLTLTPALAAEQRGVPFGTLVPHVDPRAEPGWPPFSIGARRPRTRGGRAMWRRLDPLMDRGLRTGTADLDETRRRVGLPRQGRPHGAISERLCLVGTFPQLEYPRTRALPGRFVVGPMLWETAAAAADPPPGEDPLVLVAPSTVQDPGQRLLRAALEGLADEPVRVLATTNRRGDAAAASALPHPPNARIVDWLSYARTMPLADVTVSHGGHGTVVRALASGSVPVVVPAVGDMNENAARVAWAGLGVRLPRRWAGAGPVRRAVRLALDDAALGRRVATVRLWLEAGGDGAIRSVPLVERHLLR